MAKLQAVTNPGYPPIDAVWVPLIFNINGADGQGRVEFLAYKDATTAAMNIAATLGVSGAVRSVYIASKAYSLTLEEYAAFAVTPQEAGNMLSFLPALAYELAANRLDTPDAQWVPSGEQTEADRPNVSFFHYAKDLELPGV